MPRLVHSFNYMGMGLRITRNKRNFNGTIVTIHLFGIKHRKQFGTA